MTIKVRKITLVFVLLACLGALSAYAQDDAGVRSQLEAQYKRLAEAHDRKDLKTIVGLKTPDFHAIFPDGRVGDSKTMEEYSRQFLETNVPPFNIKFTIQKLTVSENQLIAIAEVLQETSRRREMAGKLRKVETSVVQRETWAKTADGWKLKCVDRTGGSLNVWITSAIKKGSWTERGSIPLSLTTRTTRRSTLTIQVFNELPGYW
jgi:ketosteroid isomerase-like protein